MFSPWDLGSTVEVTAYTLTGVSTLVVAVRFYCRIWVVGKLKLYDYVMFVALLCTWALCVVNHYQLLFGTGEHSRPSYLPKDSPERLRYLLVGAAGSWYAYQIMYLADLALIKLSILVFYLSIATHRTFRVLVIISIAVVSVFSITMIFLNAFECPKEPSFALSPAIFTDRNKMNCFHLPTLYYSQAAFNIFSDTAILVLPMPVLIKLRMPTLKRTSLLIVFSVGLLVPIASGLRIWGLYLWTTSGAESRYNGAYVLFWSQVELNTAIVCASAPSLQPLLKRIFGELSRFQRTRNPYHYYGDGHFSMREANAGQRRPSEIHEPLSGLETPISTYQPQKRISTNDTEHDFVLVRELDEEEDIRNRVRQFASQRSSELSHEPKSPARPTEILPSG